MLFLCLPNIIIIEDISVIIHQRCLKGNRPLSMPTQIPWTPWEEDESSLITCFMPIYESSNRTIYIMISNNPKERCFCSHHLIKHSFKQKLDHLIRQRNHIKSSNKADDSQYYSLGVHHPLMSSRYLNACMNQRPWLRWYILAKGSKTYQQYASNTCNLHCNGIYVSCSSITNMNTPSLACDQTQALICFTWLITSGE